MNAANVAHHEKYERRSGGVEGPAVLIREDLVVGGVLRPLPLRYFVVHCGDVEDVAESEPQRCNVSNQLQLVLVPLSQLAGCLIYAWTLPAHPYNA